MGGDRYVLQVYVGTFSNLYEALSIEASKQTTADDIVECIAEKLGLKEPGLYELAEVIGNEGGQDCKERRICLTECPVALQLLWPKRSSNAGQDVARFGTSVSGQEYRFCLRRRLMPSMNWSFSWTDSNDSQLLKDYFLRFLYQPRDREYPDLCQLPDLTEQTLLENLKARFDKGHIYTYVGSILIAVNPFKFYPIYNPKYVQLYQNRRLGELPPHIFAIADAAYQAMLKKKYNQCIVISGESGSGKTESTNLLLHHLTALSQKGSHGSGVEQTILGAGPVLEAFGNAKTKHNNNSSRFGKFIQVNYKENGMVHGAIVQKYLLEKSRIVSQAKNERNYHVFYYLLAGSSQAEKEALQLTKPSDYFYLNQSKCYTLEGIDEAYELSRLKQSLEMVGFSAEKQRRVLSILAAVLHIGNVEFSKKSTYHNDEAVIVKNASVVSTISKLLMVREENLLSALTCKRTKPAKGETIIINYKMADAIATRDAMAKCLYGSLFDWIVMQVNQALLSKQDHRERKGHYIGVLDIFGFEDFGDQNFFEQFCINFANEHLHYYFNQHVFKYEQEEYKREGINWNNIDFHDNVGCLSLIEERPHGLLCLLDDQCNFPGATNETVLQKFRNHHDNNALFEVPPCRQSAFIIKHYAGKVKYQIRDFREKNMDLMRPDIVSLIKGSSSAFVRELVSSDMLAMFRWQVLKAFFKAYFLFSKIREQSKQKREVNGNAFAKPNTVSVIKRLAFSENRKSFNNNDFASSVHARNNSSSAIASAAVRENKNGMNSKSNNCAECRSGTLVRVASSPCPLHGLGGPGLHETVLQRANKILQKNKVNRTPSLNKSQGVEKTVRSLQTLKMLVGKTNSQFQRTGRKQMQTVTFQFQQSLKELMETLHQANPFFVRCIKSNAEKAPNHFDDMLVLVQLRYTGMLETVRIRQSGYSVRLTFEEFIQHYRILLNKGLLSSQNDIRDFLLRMNLNQDNYQMGKTKIFMRESEKLALDNLLHQEILRRIVTLQRWVRTWITRRRFLEMKNAAVCLQSHTRRWLAQQRLTQLKNLFLCDQAAGTIQRTWKAFKERQTFQRLRQVTINFQAQARGFLSRREFQKRWSQHQSSKRKSQTQSTRGSESETQQTRSSRVSSLETAEPVIPPQVVDFIEAERFTKRGSSLTDTDNFPPPLPPRRSSQSAAGSSTTDDLGSGSIVALDDDEGCVRLDRKRNKPLNKLSLKRSKSISKEQQSPESNDASGSDAFGSKMPLREMASAPVQAEHFGLEDESRATEKNAFEKAKKHIRTFITGSSGAKSERKLRDMKNDDDTGDGVAISSHKMSINSDFGIPSPDSLSPTDPAQSASSFFNFQSRHYLSNFAGTCKDDKCASCQQNIGVANTVARCSSCNLLFHLKCANTSGQIACMRLSNTKLLDSSAKPSRPPRKQPRKGKTSPTKSTRSGSESSTGKIPRSGSSWNVTRTAEFTDPKDVLITDVRELHYMETFISKKISAMEDTKRNSSKESMVDIVFKSALKEFKTNLISTYSVATPDQMHISYKNLIDHFEQVMFCVCQKENTFKTFPVIMGVNAFRGFLDEFRGLCTKYNVDEDKTKQKGGGHKRKRDKMKKQTKTEEIIESCGHCFKAVQANIPTVCEVCSSLMWLMEKVWVCQGCKLTCHKKCTSKVTSSCRDCKSRVKDAKLGLFGAPLVRLVSEEHPVPVIIEKLITAIELKGLYTEGIYRKSGTTSKIAELKNTLEKEPGKVDLDEYSVHVLTAVLKAFFRDMPEPLMSYDCYTDFLYATEISDAQERVQAIYSHISKLPKANYDLLERLLFHLARVAQHEDTNRMNANSLAIVFAPCILRTDRPMQMQDKLSDISKQTSCLQAIIQDRLKQICDTLADIDILDSAFRTASSRLSSLRQSKLHLCDTSPQAQVVDDTEEEILKEQIETLRYEKVHLTNMLPSFRLATAGSEDDLAAAAELEESTVGDGFDEPSTPNSLKPFKVSDVKLDPKIGSRSQNLRHLTKHRVGLPSRRLPSRFGGDSIVSEKRTSSKPNSDTINSHKDKPVSL